MHAPHLLTSDRLTFHRPLAEDAEAIFTRYASDPDVTRYLAWPRHETLDDSRGFLAFSDSEWERAAAGPYLIRRREDGELLGSTGLAFEAERQASTGYVLARDAWGQGYATESVGVMVRLAAELGVERLHAVCHVDHVGSRRVLEKSGFLAEGTLKQHSVFPNLLPDQPLDVLSFSLNPSAA